MKRINLKDIYPFYTEDCFVTVEDAVADTFDEFKKQEKSFERKVYRHRAYYSLDRNDGIENCRLRQPQSQYETYARKQFNKQLYLAILKLPEKQAKRIYAHFFLGMNLSEIARAEGISCHKSIKGSIEAGLAALKKDLKYFCD
jgi:RNA polymerase sigma-70 factor (ECF subfamily)